MSSLAGQNPFAGGAAYCATKAGLDAFSEALMQELRYDGIRVAHVCPGRWPPASPAARPPSAPTGSSTPTTSPR